MFFGACSMNKQTKIKTIGISLILSASAAFSYDLPDRYFAGYDRMPASIGDQVLENGRRSIRDSIQADTNAWDNIESNSIARDGAIQNTINSQVFGYRPY